MFDAQKEKRSARVKFLGKRNRRKSWGIFTRRAIPSVMPGAEVSVNRIHPSRQLSLTENLWKWKTGQSKEAM